MNTHTASVPYVEPWLRGTHTDVPAVGRAVLHAFQLAMDDLRKWTAGLTNLEIHTLPMELPPLAFHLRHIARSTDRLLTYAEGNQLSKEQLAQMKAEEVGPEHDERETLAALLAEVESSFENATPRVRTLAATDPNTFRGVGRKQLPTTVGGLLVHVADHTMRHVGQAVTTAKVLKRLRVKEPVPAVTAI
jgi:uncharacterized damage-inducible protein DinB